MKEQPLNERRTIAGAEFRADKDKRTISGYAAIFEEYSQNLGGFFEIIMPGAFDKVMNDDVRALFNHDPNIILARTKSKTLSLSVDDRGLKYEFSVPHTTAGNDLLESVARGDIDQSSFAFRVEEDEWIEDEERGYIRKIKKFRKLFDVAPVTYPAYLNTEVTVRSFQEFKDKNTEKPKEVKSQSPSHRLRLLLLE